MAAHELYKTKSIVIAGTTLKGAITFSVDETADTVEPKGDGKIYADASYVVRKGCMISVEAEDIKDCPAIGASGSFSAQATLLGAGTAWEVKTVTNATVRIKSVKRNADDGGTGRVSITAIAVSADGIADPLAWAAAGA
jgi:hypothetical protein